jgi:hypothetical protein
MKFLEAAFLIVGLLFAMTMFVLEVVFMAQSYRFPHPDAVTWWMGHLLVVLTAAIMVCATGAILLRERRSQ